MTSTKKLIYAKNFTNKIAALLNRFFNHFIFIAIFAMITFFCWYNSREMAGISIMLIAAILVFLCCNDPSPLVPLVCFASIIFSTSGHKLDLEKVLYPIAPFLIIGFLYFIIKNKTAFVGGKYFWGLLLGAIGTSLGGLFYRFLPFEVTMVTAVSFGLVLLYVFFSTYTKNLKPILFNTMIAMSLVIMLQTLVFYMRCPDIEEAIYFKSLDLGWGASNTIGLYLSMFLPVYFYYAAKAKTFGFVFVLLAVIQFGVIVASLSRGNMLFSFLFFPVLLFSSYKQAKNKLSIFIGFLISLLVGIFLIFLLWEYAQDIIERLIAINFQGQTRITRYELAFRDFKRNPIFGISFFYHQEYGLPFWYHNTILQLIGSLGIFGMAMFIPFFVQRYYLAMKYFNYSNFTMICIIILSALYAFIDVNFFLITNAILTIFIYCAMEKETDTINLFKVSFYKQPKCKETEKNSFI